MAEAIDWSGGLACSNAGINPGFDFVADKPNPARAKFNGYGKHAIRAERIYHRPRHGGHGADRLY
jgi:hypothetical protein